MTTTSRRSVLKGAGAAVLGLAAANAKAAPTDAASKTFVLIHGAWHGGWCWVRVADKLRAKGHKVFTPTLTGLADRSHLMSAQITLDTHIDDIVNFFKWNDLNDVVLVAHSYGGWPVSGAIEKLLPQVSSIVYLDAFMPENGQKGVDLNSPLSAKGLLDAVAKGEVSRPAPPASAFHIHDPKDAAWVDTKLTEQPIGVGLHPIVMTGAREKVAKKTYIRAKEYPSPIFDSWLAASKAKPDWKTYELNSGHLVMLDMPDRLIEILLERA
jgi:pimeloyl-ACP methyl ester carboxylesterase